MQLLNGVDPCLIAEIVVVSIYKGMWVLHEFVFTFLPFLCGWSVIVLSFSLKLCNIKKQQHAPEICITLLL